MSTKTIQSTEMKWDLIKHNIRGTRDLDTAGTTFTWTITDLFGNNLSASYLVGIFGRVATTFAGVTGPLWMEIGSSDDSDSIMQRINLLGARNNQQLFCHMPMGYPWLICEQNTPAKYQYMTSSPIVTITSDSGNLEDLTTGELEIVLVRLV